MAGRSLGHLADAKGVYRPWLAVALLVPVAAFLPLQTGGMLVAVLSIAVLGFSYRSTIPLLDSLVSRNLEDAARQYGKLRVAGSVGFIAISLFVQFTGLVSREAPASIFLSFGLTAVLASIAVALIPAAQKAPTHADETAPSQSASGFDLKFWVVMGVIFLGRFAIGAYYSFFSLYLSHTFDLAGVSFLWAIGPVAEMPWIFFSGRLITRFGLRALLLVSLVAVSARLALFIVAPTLLVVGLAQLLHAFTFGTFHTASVAYVNGKVPRARRGMGMAIYNSVGVGLPSFLASVLGGFILERHGYSYLFLVYALVPLAGIAVLLFFGGRLIPRGISLGSAETMAASSVEVE